MGPMFLRTLLDGKPREFGYTVVTYNLSNGSWKKEEIKVEDTKMRVEQDGQQFESNIRGWELCPKNVWLKDFETFLEIRKLRNYTGEFPMPVF